MLTRRTCWEEAGLFQNSTACCHTLSGICSWSSLSNISNRGSYCSFVYVDMILTGNDDEEKAALQKCLASEFEIKELGRLRYFLGIEVAHLKQVIFISQQKYSLELLSETGKMACKPMSTPIDPNQKIGLCSDEPGVDRGRYQRLVGRFISAPRINIAYAVSVVSQYMRDPRETHQQVVDRIVQYLKGTPGKCILFKITGALLLEAYMDANDAGSEVDRSSKGTVPFRKESGHLEEQETNVVARSSAEAEFGALGQGVCVLLWLGILLQDLKMYLEGPMNLYCDNKSAIQIAHNPAQHDRIKHIEVDKTSSMKSWIEDCSALPTFLLRSRLQMCLEKG